MRLALAFSTGSLQQLYRGSIQRPVKQVFHNHAHLWTFLIGVTVCGFLFGGVAAGQLSTNEKLILGNTLQHLLETVKQHRLADGNVLWSATLVTDIELLGLLWLFGVSIIGIPFIVVTLFLRSFTVGFAVAYTSLQFGWKGFLLSSIGIFMHQSVSLFTLLIASTIAMRFSLRIIQHRLPLPKIGISFLKYTGIFCMCGGGLMVGAFIQAYLVPQLLTHLLA